jgi:ATP-dependent RNA helicase DeaD
VKEAKLDDKVAAFLPEVITTFDGMEREELIQKILGYGLGDLSKQLSGQKPIREAAEDDRPDKKSRDIDYTTITIAAGRNKGYSVPQVIGMINRMVPGKKIAFGKIDIQNNMTYVGVDAKEARKVVTAMEGSVDKGTELNVRMFEGGTKVDGPRDFAPRKRKPFKPGGFNKKKKW